MKENLKNNLLFILATFLIGVVAGFIVWVFLSIMKLGINFLWEYIPENIEIPFYTIIVCLLGGILIGLWNKKTGNYPESMDEVFAKVKKNKKYDYNKLPIIFVSALLPIILGASIGPEAGLVGIIAGVCSWVIEKFKILSSQKEELSEMGISAILGIIFNAPLFGIGINIEEKNNNKVKLVSYFFAVLGAFLSFKLLSFIYNSEMHLPNFYDVSMETDEYVGLIFLIIIGIIAGYIYVYSNLLTKKIYKIIKNPIIIGGIAGLILGICGTYLPYTMFSGEEQTLIVKQNYVSIGASALILTAVVKLILTNICINGNLKGGHFFPVIFAGVCLGYATSLLTELDSIFCVIIVTTSLLSFIMRKPLAVILLLIMFFPPVCLIPMIIAVSLPLLFPAPNLKH